jgi:hypothetical protein
MPTTLYCTYFTFAFLLSGAIVALPEEGLEYLLNENISGNVFILPVLKNVYLKK